MHPRRSFTDQMVRCLNLLTVKDGFSLTITERRCGKRTCLNLCAYILNYKLIIMNEPSWETLIEFIDKISETEVTHDGLIIYFEYIHSFDAYKLARILRLYEIMKSIGTNDHKQSDDNNINFDNCEDDYYYYRYLSKKIQTVKHLIGKIIFITSALANDLRSIEMLRCVFISSICIYSVVFFHIHVSMYIDICI